jgi:ribosome maturation factor RimP
MSLANEHLKGSKLYVTGIRISSDNHVNVYIDGDEGVSIKDCVGLSRAIEAALDNRREDFALDVSSHGATTPLVMPRQYNKHIGRTLEIKLNNGDKAEGELVSLDDEKLLIEFSVRENKPIGKGKITVSKKQEIKFTEIKEAKIKLKY